MKGSVIKKLRQAAHVVSKATGREQKSVLKELKDKYNNLNHKEKGER